MLMAAFKNYIKYFPRFFKIFGIILLSIFIFYLVFELTIYLPLKNADMGGYDSFVDQIEAILNNLSAEDIFSSDFLSSTLKQIYEIFLQTNTKITLGTVLTIFSTLIVIGAFYYSQIDCKKRIREDVSNKDTAKSIPRFILNVILNVVFFALFFVTTYYWFFAIFLLPFVFLLLESLKTLIFTWYVYLKKYKIFQIITLPNCLRLLSTHFILLYIHIGIFILLAPHINLYLLLLLALSSYAYISSITQFTAIKFFIEKRAHRELKIAK